MAVAMALTSDLPINAFGRETPEKKEAPSFSAWGFKDQYASGTNCSQTTRLNQGQGQ
jgi:hypothetical protein